MSQMLFRAATSGSPRASPAQAPGSRYRSYWLWEGGAVFGWMDGAKCGEAATELFLEGGWLEMKGSDG